MLIIPSPNYHRGRLRRPRIIVPHTAQVPCRTGRAEGVMRYLAGAGVGASAHYCTDPDTTVAGVAETDTAWATPQVNADGLQVEQAGYAEFGSGQPIPGRPGDRDGYEAARQAYGVGARWPSWDDPEPQRMIRTQTAPLIARLCTTWAIPPAILTPRQVADGVTRGIADHATCSAAFPGSGDHWDCGPQFPSDLLLELVLAELDGTPQPPTNDQDTRMTRLIRDKATGSLYWWDGHTRVAVGTNPGETWAALETRLRNLVAAHPSAEMWPGDDASKPALWLELEPFDITAIPELAAVPVPAR